MAAQPDDYSERVSRRLAQILAQGVPPLLSAVLPLMKGASPEIVLRLLPVGAEDTRGLTPVIESQVMKYEPHPLDYEWRFTAETISGIWQAVQPKNGKCMLFGVPSFCEAHAWPVESPILVDRNPIHRTQNACEFICHDLCDGVPLPRQPRIGAVFMDSPWYLEHLITWLVRALEVVAEDGSVWFSLWPELTRPGANVEREQLFELLAGQGRYHVFEGALEYEPMLFERLAFLERGIDLSRAWRRGDLVHLKLKRQRSSLVAPELKSSEHWVRFNLGVRQLAVRETGNSELPRLYPVGAPPAWHLRSVSRRDESRKAVDIWSSSNFVAQADGESHFIDAIESWAKGEEPQPGYRETALRQLHDMGLLPQLARDVEIWRHSEWVARDLS